MIKEFQWAVLTVPLWAFLTRMKFAKIVFHINYPIQVPKAIDKIQMIAVYMSNMKRVKTRN